MNISPMLYSAAGLVEYTYWNMLLYGGFYGCLLIMVIYNLLLALSLREPMYAHFVVFLVGLLLFNLNVNGFGLQYLWPDIPKLDEYFWVGIYLSAPALALYSRRFLALGQRFPRYDRLLRQYLVAVAAMFAVQLLLPPPWSYEVSTVLVTVSLLLFSWLGWKVWSLGFRPARLYVLTWFVFWGLIFVYILGIVGWAPYSSLMATLPHVGVLWIVVMLSLALGDRIGFLERERKQLAAEARASLERHVQEIERMNRDKSTFLEYVSHELNTPINWIGAADSLSGSDNRDPLVWDLVRKGQQRLMGTVGTSLRYFDLADRAVPPLVGRCWPAPMVAALLADRDAGLRARGLTVECRMADDLMVNACENELREVLSGALDNAMRFSHPGGVIRIEGSAGAEEVWLRISDQGKGASPDQLENLFKPFFMVGSRHHEEGYGLSLAMARVMIEQVGGRTWAESGGPDKGFSLVVCLPRVAV